jgi:hypothetical protein
MTDTENKDYKGTGKFTSAVGKSYIESTVGTVIGAGVGAGVGALLPGGGRQFNAVIGGLAGGALGGAVGTVHGAIDGWSKSHAGEEQHKETLSEVEKLKLREEMRSIAKDESKGR